MAAANDSISMDQLVRKIRDEEVAYRAQLPEVRKLLEEATRRSSALVKEVQDLESKVSTLDKETGSQREKIGKRRTGKGTDTDVEDAAKELRRGIAEGVPVFVQSMCKYNAEEAKRTGGSKGIKKFFGKKSESQNPDDPRLLDLTLDVPAGATGPCMNPASGFSFILNCQEPTASIEDMATEGGRLELVFALRNPDEATNQLINSAK
eukprot:gene15091-23053_t